MKQLLEWKSWHPVKISDHSPEERIGIIPSKLFVKENFAASEVFDKLKSRLVAGGHRQDLSLYKDITSSPMVCTWSVFNIAILGRTDCRAKAAVDGSGAYLNTSIADRTRVHMCLSPFIFDVLTQLDIYTCSIYVTTEQLQLRRHYMGSWNLRYCGTPCSVTD